MFTYAICVRILRNVQDPAAWSRLLMLPSRQLAKRRYCHQTFSIIYSVEQIHGKCTHDLQLDLREIIMHEHRTTF